MFIGSLLRKRYLQIYSWIRELWFLRERLWCIRKSLCTVHKSQHNCFLYPQMKPNKTNQTRNLQSHHQHRRSSSSPYRNAKTILLWKWFLWVVLQNHFAVEMVSRIFNLIINPVVHHHHRTWMPKPFCCGKPLDVLNCFQQLYSKTIRCT